jgi:hypothetical protein
MHFKGQRGTAEKAEEKVIVAPFWRGHVQISPEEYSQLEKVFAAGVSNVLNAILDVLPHLSAVVRHNVQRIMSAALVAEHEHGKVILVEGCRANAIEKNSEFGKITRNLTGSHVGMLIGRALRHAGVIPLDVPFEHTSESRCTDWEADVLLEKVTPHEKLIGIAGPHTQPPCTESAGVGQQGLKSVAVTRA